VVERRELGGWLQGPGASSSGSGSDRDQGGYPGQRLGRPAEGPGSIAGFGRRLAGLGIDWGFALLIGYGLMRPLQWGGMAPLAALLTMHVVLVGTAGFTAGHRLVGVHVQTLDGAPPGPIRALVRSLLLCLAVPALIWDRDQRGLHDRAAGTLVVRR
jgi:uncharacterized RDD family membrane protein YckC